ncbi:hypothetical protein, partial [Mesorhizobium sp.]|uniref:hypothetical protein n=1 Tax=Mesorhizobium sp. TaxID=1871066 RepID=UPI0025DA0039
GSGADDQRQRGEAGDNRERLQSHGAPKTSNHQLCRTKGIPRKQHLVSGAGLEGNIPCCCGQPCETFLIWLRRPRIQQPAPAGRFSSVFGSGPAPVKGISLPWRVS